MTPMADSAHTRRIGVIVVDHGSRRAESNEMLEQLTRTAIADTLSYDIVEPAHMELAEPSIAAAFDTCVARGATSVVIQPYFLLPGRHWHQDIPALAEAAASRHPEVPFLVAAPFGAHPLMADVVSARVEYCLAHARGEVPECEACAGTGVCRMRTAGAMDASLDH
ncbi:MAG: cobalamin biosynthesis protein CbiX [Thermoleophilia bacterium]|nr:cobalamin biosynthesis protein CbiX [Thermoleophilia bacterium]